MTGYVERDLRDNEWVVQKATMHWAYLLPDILLCFFLIGFITLPINILKRRATELAFTNKRLLGKKGVFNINELDTPLDQVSDIKIESNIIGKICGFGAIVITMGLRRTKFIAVSHPERFRKALREQADRYKAEQMYQQMAMPQPWAGYCPQNQVWAPTYPNGYYPPQQYY